MRELSRSNDFFNEDQQRGIVGGGNENYLVWDPDTESYWLPEVIIVGYGSSTPKVKWERWPSNGDDYRSRMYDSKEFYKGVLLSFSNVADLAMEIYSGLSSNTILYIRAGVADAGHRDPFYVCDDRSGYLTVYDIDGNILGRVLK